MNNKTILISNNQNRNFSNNLTSNQRKTINRDNINNYQSRFKRSKQSKFKNYEISFNPFITAAMPIFKLVFEIKEDIEDASINDIREEFIDKVNTYTETASSLDIDENEILVIRYVLCSFVDEFMNSHFLSKDYNWSNNSLLSIFHNETYGGENFFHLLNRFLKTPAKYIHILELLYACLALGFEGKYRVISRGEVELNNIKDSLFKQIKIVQGREPFPFYSKQTPAQESYKLFNKIPYSTLFFSVSVLVLIIYSGLTFSLASQNNEFIDLINNKTTIEIDDLYAGDKK
ncbi:type IVB secretion system protein IcmH/DotU [Arcobacter sp.]|uniref:type IVB secretion system protein IcmH/DotU n=1 Tax=unclassified Arcobacter TaxID=2593671 RepID=UPI003B00C27E